MAIMPDEFISVSYADQEIVAYLNELFYQSSMAKSSDIHILSQNNLCFVQRREYGVMVDIDSISPSMADHIDTIIRARADMNKSEQYIPVDGRMSLRFIRDDAYGEEGHRIDIRVSIVPTVGGRKIVCRLLQENSAARTLNDIPMSLMARNCFDDIISMTEGLFLVSGPTGSGKTTLLYALLRLIAEDGTKNIITIENPVEYTHPKITQINVSAHISFQAGLEAALRQDPDVILFGEIRDPKTAETVVQAANTGHLVLSTIHANNSASTITRMIEMGVDPMSLTSCLRAVVAQRLLEATPRPEVLRWRAMDSIERDWINRHRIFLDNPATTSLPHDDGTRQMYKGRLPLLEMITVDHKVSKAIIEQKGEVNILNAAKDQPQFELLAESALRYALEGRTTMEQIMKVVGRDAIVPTELSEGKQLIQRNLIKASELNPLLETQAKMRKKGHLNSLEVLARNRRTPVLQETSTAPQPQAIGES